MNFYLSLIFSFPHLIPLKMIKKTVYSQVIQTSNFTFDNILTFITGQKIHIIKHLIKIYVNLVLGELCMDFESHKESVD